MNYEIRQNVQTSLPIRSSTNFDYMIYTTIGFIYAVFVSLLVDRFLNYDKVENICNNKNSKNYINDYNSRDTADLIDKCTTAKNDYDLRKFMTMFIISIVSILGGLYLGANNPIYATSGYGIAAGGMYLVIFYTIYKNRK